MQRFHQFLSENDLVCVRFSSIYMIYTKHSEIFVTIISETNAQNFEEWSKDRILRLLVIKLFT
jgi:hypothetical protein